MDGNGRWAQQRGLPRVEGHARGADSVRTTVEECCRLGIGQLTLYCLSSENWKRPKTELDFLMVLLEQYLVEERREILEQNIRFSVIGRRDELPAPVLREIDESIRLSQDNTGMGLCLAINYGGRTELIDAVRTLAARRPATARSTPTPSTRPPSAAPCTRPACPTPTCSFARPARCA